MATVTHPQHVVHAPRHLPQKVCVGLGWAFILIGVLGFIIPGFMGMHLGVAHNAIHLLSGVMALMAGLSEKPKSAYLFSLWFGSIYGLLGVAGFLFGKMAFPSMGYMLHEDRFLLSVIPGALEFGTNDHIIHILIAAAFLLPNLKWRSRQINP
jgi:uncharacterized membrane protein HdeD (DUF308 family)